MNMGMNKKQKVQSSSTTRQSLFGKLPDEMVLTILAYGEMEDIESTRVWQSKKVQHCTHSRSNFEASYNNNFDNLKWIYDFIGDTDFTHKISETINLVLNCTGNDLNAHVVYNLTVYFY